MKHWLLLLLNRRAGTNLVTVAFPRVLLGAVLIAGVGSGSARTFTAAYRAALQRMPNLLGASLIAILMVSLITVSIWLIKTGLFMSLMSLGDSTSGRRQATGTLLLGGCLIGSSLLLIGIAVLLGVLLVGMLHATMRDSVGLGIWSTATTATLVAFRSANDSDDPNPYPADQRVAPPVLDRNLWARHAAREVQQ